MNLGSVKDECYLSTLSFMKSKLRSTNYTFGFDCENVYVRTLQIQNFFLKDIIKGWVDNKVRYVMDC
jgi:hypothetical protein